MYRGNSWPLVIMYIRQYCKFVSINACLAVADKNAEKLGKYGCCIL